MRAIARSLTCLGSIRTRCSVSIALRAGRYVLGRLALGLELALCLQLHRGLTSAGPRRVWCGQQDRWVALTAVMDCHTREILGWRLTRNGNAKAAEATLEDALIGRFGSLARLAQPLVLRSDNGLVFTSKRFTVTVRRYGVDQEFIQPHTPQQNGMIERLFRTIKEQCIWLNRFDSLDEAKSVIGRWIDWYNYQRPHQALKMKTPAEVYKLAA
jgi:putative transposase